MTTLGRLRNGAQTTQSQHKPSSQTAARVQSSCLQPHDMLIASTGHTCTACNAGAVAPSSAESACRGAARGFTDAKPGCDAVDGTACRFTMVTDQHHSLSQPWTSWSPILQLFADVWTCVRIPTAAYYPWYGRSMTSVVFPACHDLQTTLHKLLLYPLRPDQSLQVTVRGRHIKPPAQRSTDAPGCILTLACFLLSASGEPMVKGKAVHARAHSTMPIRCCHMHPLHPCLRGAACCSNAAPHALMASRKELMES